MKTSIFLIVLFASGLIQASEPGEFVWVSCSGEASLQNITYEEAQALARKRARQDAIEKGCGVALHAESFVHNFQLAGDFIHALSYGEVIDEKDLKWETVTLSEKPVQSGPPSIVLRLTMSALVKPVSGKSDPLFKVRLELNRPLFESGEEVIFTIHPTQDCYLTILNLAANDSVYVLFPNDLKKNCFVQAGSSQQFPSQEDRERGLHIRVDALPGHPQDAEMVKVIATKQNVPFLEKIPSDKDFSQVGTPKVTVLRLAKWLAEIPVDERAEASAVYTVKGKKED